MHGYFLLFYLELGDTISGFFGGKDNKDDKKPTTDETAQEVSMSCLQCDFILLLTNFFPYLQFSLWVSFSFSFKFILFFLNHHMICLKNQCKLLFDFFFPGEFGLYYYFFFGSTACFFCIKGDKPGDKSGEGKTESEAQQPKPDSGDEKVPL